MKQQGWIIPYLKQNARLFAIVISIGLVTAFSAAFLMFTSGFLISKAATRPENLLLIYVPIVAVRTFGILRAVTRYIERLTGHHVILKILSNMRLRVYELIEPRILKEGTTLHIGDLLGVMAEDIEYLQDVYVKTIFPSIIGVLLYIVSVIMLGAFSWPFAALMALYGFVLVVLFPLISLLVTKRRVEKIKKRRSLQYGRLTDAVVGIADWVFSGKHGSFIKQFEKNEHEIRRDEKRRFAFVRYRNFASQCVVGAVILSMILWTGNQHIDGEISRTLIAAFVLILFPLTESFLPLSDALSELPGYEDSLNRLTNLSTSEISTKHENKFAQNFDEIKADLRCKEVSYVSIEGEEILSNLTLNLRSGTKTAILGPSGSGKTTLLKLLQGMIVPTDGKITMNEVETFTLNKEKTSRIGVLNQQPYLFDTTVMNNIRLGKPSATDEEIYHAAKRVKLHEYIQSLPEGYLTSMQEAGIRFSGGERQRIALARILLQDNPVVLLDEPTVGLDPRTEKELLSTIFSVLEQKTVVWVTHHLVGMKEMDSVVFLEEGKILMEGTHEQLLESSDRYRNLYQLDVPFHFLEECLT